MEGQDGKIKNTTNNRVILPKGDYVTIFRDSGTGVYYGKLPNGTLEPISGGSGAGDWSFDGNVLLANTGIGSLNAFDVILLANGSEVGRLRQLDQNLALTQALVQNGFAPGAQRAVDPNNAVIRDENGIVAIGWNNGDRTLRDELGQNKILWGGTGVQLIDSNNNAIMIANLVTRDLYHTGGTLSIDFQNDELVDDAGSHNANWSTGGFRIYNDFRISQGAGKAVDQVVLAAGTSGAILNALVTPASKVFLSRMAPGGGTLGNLVADVTVGGILTINSFVDAGGGLIDATDVSTVVYMIVNP